MQNLIAKWELPRLTKSALLVIGCLLLWFLPFTHDFCKDLDLKTFAWLNQSLLDSHSWQLLWGYLNHPNETWLNVVFMGGLNILGIYMLPQPQRKRATALVIYFWLFFQIALLLTNKIFLDWLDIHRDSPSVVIEPWVILSDALQIENIKVYSHNSFPAGHVFVLVFWLQFTELYCRKWLLALAWITVVMLTLPRMFSGAHWLSDIVFTISYAMLWFSIAISTPLYAKIINKLEKIL